MVTMLRLLVSGVLYRAAHALSAAARLADPVPGRIPPRSPSAPHSDAQRPQRPSLYDALAVPPRPPSGDTPRRPTPSTRSPASPRRTREHLAS
jgi:hypothetical protein